MDLRTIAVELRMLTEDEGIRCVGLRGGWIVPQLRVLQDRGDSVDAKACDPAVQPVGHDGVEGRPNLRLPPVEVRLLAQVGVPVVLAGLLVQVPWGSAEARGPVVGGRSVGLRIGPHVPVAVSCGPGGPGVDEPRMAVAGVARNEVHEDPDPAAPGLGDEPVHVVLAPQLGVDRQVVGHVVAPVRVRRDVDRTEPDAVHPQPAQVVEVVDDPSEVADAVAVRVGERSGIDLVEDSRLPPWRARCGGHRRRTQWDADGSGANGCTVTQQVPWALSWEVSWHAGDGGTLLWSRTILNSVGP